MGWWKEILNSALTLWVTPVVWVEASQSKTGMMLFC